MGKKPKYIKPLGKGLLYRLERPITECPHPKNLRFDTCFMGAAFGTPPPEDEYEFFGGIAIMWEGQRGCGADHVAIDYIIYSTKPTVLVYNANEYQGELEVVDYSEYGLYEMKNSIVKPWVQAWANYKKNTLGVNGFQQFDAEFNLYTVRDGTRSDSAVSVNISQSIDVDRFTS